MRICTVGSGRMAANHSRALGSLTDVRLHTVVDPDMEYADTFRRQYGYEKALPSLEEALAADGFDAVVVWTPNPLHAPQSAQALRAGKHVLCEIPLALSLTDAEELRCLAEENDLRLMVCHTERFGPDRVELRRRIAAGELHPMRILARFFMLRRGQLKTKQARHGWVDNALWHHGCHSIDTVMDILGPHAPCDLHVLFGSATPPLGLPLEVDLHWRATSPITGDEALVGVSLSHNALWGVHDYYVICREDCLISNVGVLRNRDGVVVDRSQSSMIHHQDTEFVAAVREGRSPAIDADTVLPTIKILQAAWDIWLAKERQSTDSNP